MLAWRQLLFDPRLRNLAIVSVLLAGGIAAALIAAGVVVQDMVLGLSDGWLAAIANWLTGFALVLLLWLLFPSLILLVMSLFLDRVLVAVEARYYPSLPPPQGLNWTETVQGAMGSLIALIGLNILLIPLYIGMLIVPPLAFLVGVLINGYFLGREYFEMVAWRRMGLAEARQLWRTRRGIWYRSGVVIGLVSIIPGLNLVAPIVAAAFMSHLILPELPGGKRVRTPFA